MHISSVFGQGGGPRFVFLLLQYITRHPLGAPRLVYKYYLRWRSTFEHPKFKMVCCDLSSSRRH